MKYEACPYEIKYGCSPENKHIEIEDLVMETIRPRYLICDIFYFLFIYVCVF